MKIFRIIAVSCCVLSAGLFGSCDKFLTEKVLDKTDLANYIRSDEEAVKFFYGGLAAVKTVVFGHEFTSLTELPTDNTYYLTNDVPRVGLNTLSLDNENKTVETVWGNLYATVAQMNILIDKLENNPQGITPTNAVKLLGQAKFIRAWSYFQLVQLWGEVPVTPAYHTTSGNIRPERSSVEKVYETILEDIEYAVAHTKDHAIKSGAYAMPDTIRVSIAGGINYFLPISKGAVSLLAAKVYLVKKDYANAEKHVNYLLDKPDLFDLLPNYGDLFDADKKTVSNRSKEVLWEMESQALSGFNNTLHREMAPGSLRGLKTVNGTAVTLVGATTGYQNYVPTQDLLVRFNYNDKRYRWMYQVTERRLPAIRKGFDIKGTADLGGPAYVLLRYADALLIKAEIVNEGGNPTGAETYVNPVRNRAGLAPLSGLSQSQMRDLILNERRLEFAHEAGNRLYDLRRTGRYIEVMQKFKESCQFYLNLTPVVLQVINPGWTGSAPSPGVPNPSNPSVMIDSDYFELPVPFVTALKNVESRHILHPIPYYEVRENKNINNSLHFPNWN